MPLSLRVSIRTNRAVRCQQPRSCPPPAVPQERYTDFGGHKTGHAGRDRARNAVYLAPAAAENREEHDQADGHCAEVALNAHPRNWPSVGPAAQPRRATFPGGRILAA